MIDPEGRKAKVYITQMSYSAIGQLGQLLAQEASSLLPGHPAVHSNVSYARMPPITPTQTVTLPRAGGGTVPLGPGKSAHLYLFFATWDRETSGLAGQLDRAQPATRPRPDGSGCRRSPRSTRAASSHRRGALRDFLRAACRVRCPIRSRSTAPAGSPMATRCSARRGSCSSREPGGSSTTERSRPPAGRAAAC